MVKHFFIVLFFLSAALFGQNYPEYLDKEASLIKPEHYQKEKEYPLLVILPYTTGSAESFYQLIKKELPKDRFLILLPKGTIQRSDYLPDFIKYVGWYEKRLLKDIASAKKQYNIDQNKIILCGYSLGGDLSWAFAMRNPELFKGFVAAGTRCSYPFKKKTGQLLKKRNFHAAFIVGKNELAVRYQGINYAKKLLRDSGVKYSYKEFSGGHIFGPADYFVSQILKSCADK